VTRKGVSEQQEEAEKKKYENAFSSRPSTPTPVNSGSASTAASASGASGAASGSGSGGGSLSRSSSRSSTRSEDGFDDELSDVETETVTSEYDDEDVIEVGRGLANYNYQQITRVKGMNRYVLLSSCFLLFSLS
jgi:glutamate 5-kinase